jgi:hypothetical protein
MADEPANLVLEFLRANRGDIADLRLTQLEHGHRFNRIELAVAGLRRDLAQDAELA